MSLNNSGKAWWHVASDRICTFGPQVCSQQWRVMAVNQRMFVHLVGLRSVVYMYLRHLLSSWRTNIRAYKNVLVHAYAALEVVRLPIGFYGYDAISSMLSLSRRSIVCWNWWFLYVAVLQYILAQAVYTVDADFEGIWTGFWKVVGGYVDVFLECF